MPSIAKKTVGTPLLMLNTGTDAKMKFALSINSISVFARCLRSGMACSSCAPTVIAA